MSNRGVRSFAGVRIVILALFVMAGTVFAQPGPRGYVDLVYVPQVQKALLVGGQLDFLEPYRAVGGTWWYDPADDTWSEVTSEPQPGVRSAAHLAVHDPTGTVVMFGGGVPVDGGFQTFNETWLFDPVEERWSQLSFEEGASPQAQIGEMFAYHEASDLFVLHGGFTLDGMRFLNDTWHFDLAEGAWTKVEPATSPPGMNYKAFAYDPRTEQLVLSGGVVEEADDTWTYDPRDPDWQRHEKQPETRWVDYVRMVYDPNLDTLIRFGGTNEDEGAVWSVSEDLEWSLLDIEGESPPRMSRHAMTAVPGLGVLVYGGVYRGRPDFASDMWVINTVEGRWELR